MLDESPPPVSDVRSAPGTLVGVLRSRKRLVLAGIAFGAALSAAYVGTATPHYTAVANVLIDSRASPVSAREAAGGMSPLEISEIESQLELMRSEKIVRGAIEDLPQRLRDQMDREDPSLPARFSKALSQLRRYVVGPPSAEPTAGDRAESRVAKVLAQLTVRRLGLAYVAEVSFTADTAELAAAVANAVPQAYLRDQISGKSKLWRGASEWLQQRLVELGTQANTAAHVAQDYKADHQIVDTGSRGLVNEQQLQEINTALLAAQAKTVEAASKRDQVEKVLASGSDAMVSDALADGVVLKLRAQYADLSQRASEFEAKYGPRHDAVLKLQAYMESTRQALHEEMLRIDETLKGDYDVALARQNSLEGSFRELLNVSSVTSRARVRSHELDRTADAYETLYTSLLQRYTDAVNQQSYPIATAEIISQATEPVAPSSPKVALTLVMGAMVGAGLGAAAAFAREATDRSVRHARQVEQLGVPCYAMLPVMEREPRFAQHRTARLEKSEDADWSAAASRFKAEFLLHVPESYFAFGLRKVRTQITVAGLRQSTKVIGITSSSSGEGKSTFAANLAHVFARPSCRTLLIDADLCRPTVSGLFSPKAKPGLAELMEGKATFWDVVTPLSNSGLSLITAGGEHHPEYADLLGSDRMRAIIEEARASFDCVIVDLPPVSQVASTREISPLLDGVVLVAAWRKTNVAELREALHAFDFDPGKVIGVVLNKAAPSALGGQKTYEAYQARYNPRAAA